MMLLEYRVGRACTNIVLLLVLIAPVNAEMTADELARLGANLTPLGGEKAGNAEGTIPAWDGGLTQPPAAYIVGQHYLDPFADDPIKFTITATNIEDHADKLTEGHKALLKAYPASFKLNIYASRRSSAAPQYIYNATRQFARDAKLNADGNGVSNIAIGIPFPLPVNGLEAIWNHMLRWRGNFVDRRIAQAAPTQNGNYTLVEFSDQISFQYNQQAMTINRLDNILLYFKQQVQKPARLAGGILLVHETLNQKIEHRKAWFYNPGQRRVRRTPNVAFDNPGTASDGMRTNDQLDMYNGSPERYDWHLLGKREVYVPYNNYRLQDPTVKYADILKPLHINPDLPRYELHRVWVVDATLKEGASHIYKRRTFYIDEDSWQILIVDQYDGRDQLWRISEAFAINHYNVPNLWTTLETHTDLKAERYIAIGLTNESRPYDFNVQYTTSDFTVSALRRAGKR